MERRGLIYTALWEGTGHLKRGVCRTEPTKQWMEIHKISKLVLFRLLSTTLADHQDLPSPPGAEPLVLQHPQAVYHRWTGWYISVQPYVAWGGLPHSPPLSPAHTTPSGPEWGGRSGQQGYMEGLKNMVRYISSWLYRSRWFLSRKQLLLPRPQRCQCPLYQRWWKHKMIRHKLTQTREPPFLLCLYTTLRHPKRCGEKHRCNILQLFKPKSVQGIVPDKNIPIFSIKVTTLYVLFY